MSAEEERTQAARELAESALVMLLERLDGGPLELIVIGGLVPETLRGGDTPTHLGTTDIDVLIAVHVSDLQDASAVEDVLAAMNLRGTGYVARDHVPQEIKTSTAKSV